MRLMMRDPRSGALLCFGTHGTILRSQDRGLTWLLVPSGTGGGAAQGDVRATHRQSPAGG